MTGGVKGCHREAALPPPLQRGRQCVPLLVAMTGRMLTGQAPESAPSSLTGTALSTCHFRNARDDEAEGKSRWSGGTGLPREEQQRKRDLGEAEERGEVHGGQGVCRGGKCDLGCLFCLNLDLNMLYLEVDCYVVFSWKRPWTCQSQCGGLGVAGQRLQVYDQRGV